MNEQGFSLIEVLVAITLLAIGLLGVAGMQATAISNNVFAQSGTAAIALAEEMVDRVRTHCGNTPNAYNGIRTNGSFSSLSGSALADAEAWKAELEDPKFNLPNARGEVDVALNSPTDNTAIVTVRVFWGTRSVKLTTIVNTWGT